MKQVLDGIAGFFIGLLVMVGAVAQILLSTAIPALFLYILIMLAIRLSEKV